MIKEFLSASYEKIFQHPPEVSSFAPGRINIIGEHTDYNLGYVLPAAVHLRVHFLCSERNDNKVCIRAENYKEEDNFFLNDINFSEEKKWINYIKGIFWILDQQGFQLSGINGLVYGDIPFEAGLSSSAALEVSVLNGLDRLFNIGLSAEKKALFAQKAENDFVGVKCGPMDQFAAVYGQKNKVIFLDCESLDFKEIPLNLNDNDLIFLVYNSRIRRKLASSEYNQRRLESTAARSPPSR